MSVPTLLSKCCRSSYDCTRDVSLMHQHTTNNIVVCRHSTGSYATSSSTHTGEGLVDVPPLSRVSIDTVSSLGDVFHDAGRLSRRSLVGRDYENTHHHHGVMMDVYHHHTSVPSPGMIDVAYSNVAAILAMDGANIRSYPWVATGNVAPSRSDDVHDERCCSHDEMKSPTNHMVDGVLTRSSAVAMLQNALETALSRETGMNE